MYMGSPTDTGAGATVSVLLALDDKYDFAGESSLTTVTVTTATVTIVTYTRKQRMRYTLQYAQPQ
jgi:hypothetical protein